MMGFKVEVVVVVVVEEVEEKEEAERQIDKGGERVDVEIDCVRDLLVITSFCVIR